MSIDDDFPVQRSLHHIVGNPVSKVVPRVGRSIGIYKLGLEYIKVDLGRFERIQENAFAPIKAKR